jgi:hypothetical protein
MSYTIIADIGNTLVSILKKNLVPKIISDESLIGLCSPNENENFILSVYLYNIEQNQDMRMNSYISQGTDTQVRPPMFLNLYYMITPHSQSEIKFKSYENQIILGKTIQVLNDYSMFCDNYGNKLHIDMINLSCSEKSNILSNFETKNSNLSLFYKIAPAEIESTNTRHIVRVSDFDFSSGFKS